MELGGRSSGADGVAGGGAAAVQTPTTQRCRRRRGGGGADGGAVVMQAQKDAADGHGSARGALRHRRDVGRRSVHACRWCDA